MKRILSLFFVLTATVVVHAVQITGFGTGDFTATTAFGTDTPGANSYLITGTDFGSTLVGSIATPVSSLGSVNALYLIGTLTFTTNPGTNFQVGLYDSNGNGRLYQANWSSFTTSGVQQEITLSYAVADGAFNGTASVITLSVSGPGNSINFSLNNLATTSAVPEPATFAALFGLASLGFCAVRRRRKA